MTDSVPTQLCPHPWTEFVDVVLTDGIGYENRLRCTQCGIVIHVHIGPFGIPLGTRVVESESD